MTRKWWIIVGIIVLAALWLGGTYNGLVKRNEAINGQWAQVETQYQRRFDLIPNLVNSVKGIMAQEQKVFGDLAEARTRYAGASSPEAKVRAANDVESALGRLLVIVENYPQLRSSETVQTLMIQLEGTENRISVERGRYNDAVKDYTVRIKRFPTNIVAGLFGFDERSYFQSQSGAENAPTVTF
ncbi:MAG: LemA family protein [Candidatus Yanofskybacteria bacterium RIFCSPLOWO2_12_FULL_44_13b]|uniref:LemA family protein n=2 Tax=Candidatus Yanofskyibacteriota TaxID=1752733 RepID=A0A1F8H2D8_9BACT|nr:MAG: LemA protein [Candidatus Yanofskybacteria bacterium GW2011_GWA2_44_10]KKT89963.1 MAG: LemA protein [Candidatus Yanofskybacteria bacterium GW2011_GWB1_45_11]OGN02086.1 MAG: LemA family protein [Candidatus Yanofskybacteria bacterium RIFCSPHIGHO2_01_FULL_44_110b]OGN18524.1 MAG: LemA family protein [Candidatus Yanofskybacteria bacterium RIFCSPHIGHO2_12_FULL_44_29b]OGN26500.1 MAG: LemA family protein [Candidatus Yanofskybacteria bacterium RIFCSPLOWO2_01_FULL_44_88]OGN31450.1 MAG: LemA famil